MAKKNNNDSIIINAYDGLGNDLDKLFVQKSRPLLDIVRLGLSLEELKLFDTFLARINSHNPNVCTVVFEKGELEKLYGVSRIRNEKLDEYLRNLMKPIEIRDGKKKLFINLFSIAFSEKCDDGLHRVKMMCSPIARKYIFNIDNLGYLKYSLKDVTSIASKYSYILFIYLKDNSYLETWTVSLSHLKDTLGCNSKRYDEFKFFRVEILERCKKEIESKTNLRFSYDLLKEKRVVKSIAFTAYELERKSIENYSLSALTSVEIDDSIETKFDDEEINYGGELANLLGSVACNNEFSPEQIRVLQDLCLRVFGSYNYVYHDNLVLCDYLSEKYNLMNLYKPEPTKRFNYLRSIIEKQIAE